MSDSVRTVATESGGCKNYSAISTAAVMAALPKAEKGNLYGFQCFNLGASAVFIKVYDIAVTPTASHVPIWRGVIPGNTAGAGFVIPIENGLECLTGIAFRVSGAIADSDTTVLNANEVIVNVNFK